jgi:hypothetical protein
VKTLLLILLLPLASRAQVLTTKYVTAASNFREVGGRLYNIDLSTNWWPIRVRIISRNDNSALATYLIPKMRTVYFSSSQNANQSIGAYSGGGGGSYRKLEGYADGKTIEIKNCPMIGVTAEADIKAMQIGVSKSGVELWDCGKPHIVPVVTTNFPPALNRQSQ